MGVPYAEVIGDPIAHSKSPLIHKFWLERLGLARDYRACRISPSDLGNYLDRRRADPDWRGCNLTMPLKTEALDHLAEINGEASKLGAVNCIAPRAAGLWGTNFDSAAILEIMAPRRWNGHAILLGAGGGARAALWALALAGFDKITIMARDPAKAQAMIDDMAVKAEAAPLLRQPACDFLVNATPLGMTGHPAPDIRLDRMPDDAVVMDMVYDPIETPLLVEARRRGLVTIDGLTMLVEQAALSFVTFFAKAPDRRSRAELRKWLTR